MNSSEILANLIVSELTLKKNENLPIAEMVKLIKPRIESAMEDVKTSTKNAVRKDLSEFINQL